MPENHLLKSSESLLGFECRGWLFVSCPPKVFAHLECAQFVFLGLPSGCQKLPECRRTERRPTEDFPWCFCVSADRAISTQPVECPRVSRNNRGPAISTDVGAR